MWTRCREWASPLQQRGTILIDYPITFLGPTGGNLKDPIASGKAVTTNERPGAKCHSTRRRGEGPASLIEVRVRGGRVRGCPKSESH